MVSGETDLDRLLASMDAPADEAVSILVDLSLSHREAPR